MLKSLIPAAALAFAALTAQADELSVQLHGPALAESGGFLVAAARGFYAEEGLQVTLHPADTAPPFEALARGEADLAIDWLPTALVARENGLPVVNIAQILAKPALRLTCLQGAGISTADDLRGKTIGSRFGGAEYPLLAWLTQLKLVPDDSLSGVALLAQWPGTDMLRQKQAACISTFSYDPVAGDGLRELAPRDQAADMPEDGVYALASTLADPASADRLARFLRASMKGWHEATTRPEESARLILGPDAEPEALARQADMLRRIGPLLSDTGALDEADYRRAVENLRAGGVLHRDPQGAYTPAISAMIASPEPAPDSGG